MLLGSKFVASVAKKQHARLSFRSILKQPIALSKSQYFSEFLSCQNDADYVKTFMQDKSVPYNEKLVILDYLFQANPDLGLDGADPPPDKPVLLALFESQDLVLGLYTEFLSNLGNMDCSELLQFISVVGDELDADCYRLILEQTRRVFAEAESLQTVSDNPTLVRELNELLVSLMFFLQNKKFDPPVLRPDDLGLFWSVFQRILDLESKIDFLNSYLTFARLTTFDELALRIVDDVFRGEFGLDSTYFCNFSFALLRNCTSQLEAELNVSAPSVEVKFHLIDLIRRTPLADLPGGHYLTLLERVALRLASSCDLLQLSQLFSNALMMQVVTKSPLLSQKLLLVFSRFCVPEFPDEFIFQTNYKVAFLASDSAALHALAARTDASISYLKCIESFMLENKLNLNLRIIKRFENFLLKSRSQPESDRLGQNTKDHIRGLSEKDLIFQYYFHCLSALAFLVRMRLLEGRSPESIRSEPVVSDLENGFQLSVAYLKAVSENPFEYEMIGPDSRRPSDMSFDEFHSHAVEGFSDALHLLQCQLPSVRPAVREMQRILDLFCESLDSDSEL